MRVYVCMSPCTLMYVCMCVCVEVQSRQQGRRARPRLCFCRWPVRGLFQDNEGKVREGEYLRAAVHLRAERGRLSMMLAEVCMHAKGWTNSASGGSYEGKQEGNKAQEGLRVAC